MNDPLSSPIISVTELAARLDDPNLVVVDCRFSLADPSWGEREFRAAHIRGSVYAHLDRDLSGPVVPGQSGRHPLPAPEKLAETFSSWGIGPGVSVVSYDAAGGGLAASRLWWLLGWLGHDNAAVLDGGWHAWQAWAAHHPDVQIGHLPDDDSPLPDRLPHHFTPHLRPDWVVDAVQVTSMIAAGRPVFDVRTAERYRGENETIDPVAGHIPGALSLPYTGNLGPDSHFLGRDALATRLSSALGGTTADETAVYCGSGVTAAQVVLAMRHAGLGTPRLYAGSWSEWIAADRPVAVGEEG